VAPQNESFMLTEAEPRGSSTTVDLLGTLERRARDEPETAG
jgi:hypothetical protein